MSNRNYPTRMYEIPGVDLIYRDAAREFHFYADETGRLRYKNSGFPLEDIDADKVINHPDRIIREPRLTREQIEMLKTFHTLGFNWLSADENERAYVYEKKPKKQESVWAEGGTMNPIHKEMPMNTLSGIVSWDDPEPLDIVQVLRDNGVCVDG